MHCAYPEFCDDTVTMPTAKCPAVTYRQIYTLHTVLSGKAPDCTAVRHRIYIYLPENMEPKITQLLTPQDLNDDNNVALTSVVNDAFAEGKTLNVAFTLDQFADLIVGYMDPDCEPSVLIFMGNGRLADWSFGCSLHLNGKTYRQCQIDSLFNHPDGRQRHVYIVMRMLSTESADI